MNEILKAARFAANAHRDQKRKYTDLPYITHPCRVAGRVAIHPLANEAAVCAAYLHDVVEDCGVTLTQLKVEFGEEVAGLVAWLTNPSKGSKAPRAERKALDREHIAKAPQIAKVIKLIDRIDNMSEMDGGDEDFVCLYRKETTALLNEIGDADFELGDELRLYILGSFSA